MSRSLLFINFGTFMRLHAFNLFLLGKQCLLLFLSQSSYLNLVSYLLRFYFFCFWKQCFVTFFTLRIRENTRVFVLKISLCTNLIVKWRSITFDKKKFSISHSASLFLSLLCFISYTYLHVVLTSDPLSLWSYLSVL